MNALRNLFGGRALNYFRQNGQNALINLTQPVAVENGAPTAPGDKTHDATAGCSALGKLQRPDSLLIPKSILDATTFKGKQFPPPSAKTTGQLSPTTLKHIRRMEKKVELVYRCKICNTRNIKLVAEAAYRTGVVILQCDGCAVNHLIIDNVGWFAKTSKNGNNSKSCDSGISCSNAFPAYSDNVKVVKLDQNGALI